MHAVHLVVALAIVQFIFFAMLVARARTVYRIPAPATSGHEQFERLYRVQMNTLEQLVAFLPALLLAAQYWPPLLMAAIGAVYLVGRMLYWRSYVRDPASRAIGFGLTILPTFALLLAVVVEAVRGMVS